MTGANGGTGATGSNGADGALNAWSLTGNTATNSDFIGSLDSSDFMIKTNSQERMLITANGNTYVQKNLNVYGDITAGGVSISQQRAYGFVQVNKINIGLDSLSRDDITVKDSSLFLQSQSNAKNTIINSNNAGNVGIGTSTPTEKLTVAGNAIFLVTLHLEENKQLVILLHQGEILQLLILVKFVCHL